MQDLDQSFLFVVQIEFDRDTLPDRTDLPKRVIFADDQLAADFLAGLVLEDTEMQPMLRYTEATPAGQDGTFSVIWTDRSGGEHLVGMVYRVPTMG